MSLGSGEFRPIRIPLTIPDTATEADLVKMLAQAVQNLGSVVAELAPDERGIDGRVQAALEVANAVFVHITSPCSVHHSHVLDLGRATAQSDRTGSRRFG